MNNVREKGGAWGTLRVLGHAWDGLLVKHIEGLPNNTFHRAGTDILYKDSEGTVKDVFNLNELTVKSLSVDDVFSTDGMIRFVRKNGEAVFITRSPEDHWMRVWIPLKAEDEYRVRDLLRHYQGLAEISFDEVATMPIQIGGAESRKLKQLAVYFELNSYEYGADVRFPKVNPIVEKYASKGYGKPPSQLEFPHK